MNFLDRFLISRAAKLHARAGVNLEDTYVDARLQGTVSTTPTATYALQRAVANANERAAIAEIEGDLARVDDGLAHQASPAFWLVAAWAAYLWEAALAYFVFTASGHEQVEALLLAAGDAAALVAMLWFVRRHMNADPDAPRWRQVGSLLAQSAVRLVMLCIFCTHVLGASVLRMLGTAVGFEGTATVLLARAVMTIAPAVAGGLVFDLAVSRRTEAVVLREEKARLVARLQRIGGRVARADSFIMRGEANADATRAEEAEVRAIYRTAHALESARLHKSTGTKLVLVDRSYTTATERRNKDLP